jgi:hypothetical protein
VTLDEFVEVLQRLTVFYAVLSVGVAGLLIAFAKPDSEIRDDDDY